MAGYKLAMFEGENKAQAARDPKDLRAGTDTPNGTTEAGFSEEMMRRIGEAEERLRRAETELRWSEQHLRMVVNGAQDYAIFMVDPDGIVLTWNEGAERMKLWKADEIVGKPFRILYRPEDREAGRPEHNLKNARSRGGYEETYPRMKKDGTVFVADVNIHPVTDDATGELLGFSKVVRDVTERQLLLQRVVSAQENERRRISRELHDESGQHLAALTLGLKHLENAITSYCPPDTGASEQLLRLRAITEQLSKEVHRVAVELRPTSLDDLGLIPALRHYVAQWSQRIGVGVQFDNLMPEDQRLPEMVETTAYRVVQEALTNIARHAVYPTSGSATVVSVILQKTKGQIQVTVEDNGPGFDVAAAALSGRLGLSGMQERAASVGGTLEIESSPGEGTTIYLRVPVPMSSRSTHLTLG